MLFGAPAVMGQDALTICKAAVQTSSDEIQVLNQKLAAQDAYILQLKQQRDANLNQATAAAPGFLHELGCGMVGAAAGIVLIRGFR